MTRTAKKCSICGEMKPLHEFVTDRKTKDGRSTLCRPCKRETSRKSRAGTLEPSTRYEVVWPRECPRCGEMKGEDEYPLDPKRKSGRHSYCRKCRSEDARERAKRRRDSGLLADDLLRRSARLAGTTVEEVTRLNQEQAGRCKICGGLPTGNHGRLVLDHDHETGEFRGLLCGMCNAALGHMEDDTSRLRAAIEYLEESRNGAQRN